MSLENIGPIIVCWALLIGGFVMVQRSNYGKRRVVCTQCSTVSMTRRRPRGSGAVELVLWCCLVVPGLLYSVWRRAQTEYRCPVCHAPAIDAETPRGRALVQAPHTT